jgi:hypothetical protein
MTRPTTGGAIRNPRILLMDNTHIQYLQELASMLPLTHPSENLLSLLCACQTPHKGPPAPHSLAHTYTPHMGRGGGATAGLTAWV